MPESLTLKSPAKINLYLRVNRKRPDGFHDITTIFERLNLFDTITFTENNSGKIIIECNHKHVPTGRKNLVHKVARLLQEKTDTNKGALIRINKMIPVAAGLAGGSSNAATTLLGLNRLWRLKLSKDELIQLGRKIGSDVAFFLYDCSFALGTERGDKIKPLKIRKTLHHVLVVPCVKLYASKVYGALKFKLTQNNVNVNILIHRLCNNSINSISSLILNDLEVPILKLQPQLGKLKQKFKLLGVQGVMISGSGPAVFGMIESKAEAERLKTILSKTYSQAFVVSTL